MKGSSLAAGGIAQVHLAELVRLCSCLAYYNVEHQLRSLTKLFQKMDDEGNGSLTLAHFEKHFQDEEVKVLFEALELGATDAWTLFLSLDHNEDYQILPEEFLEGCLRLRGTAKAIDIFMLRRQIGKLALHLSETACSQQQLAQKLADIQ